MILAAVVAIIAQIALLAVHHLKVKMIVIGEGVYESQNVIDLSVQIRTCDSIA